jgi:hypothetical protein
MAFMGDAWAWRDAGQVREVALAWQLPGWLFVQAFKVIRGGPSTSLKHQGLRALLIECLT